MGDLKGPEFKKAFFHGGSEDGKVYPSVASGTPPRLLIPKPIPVEKILIQQLTKPNGEPTKPWLDPLHLEVEEYERFGEVVLYMYKGTRPW